MIELILKILFSILVIGAFVWSSLKAYFASKAYFTRINQIRIERRKDAEEIIAQIDVLINQQNEILEEIKTLKTEQNQSLNLTNINEIYEEAINDDKKEKED
jgi:hypothetical protein